MNKKKIAYCVYFCYVILTVLIVYLFIFPLSPSTSSRVNTSVTYELFPLSVGTTVSQYFSGDVDDMNNVTLSFEYRDLDLKDYTEEQLKQVKKGSLIAKIYNDDHLIAENKISVKDIFIDSNWNIPFEPYKNTFNKLLRLDLTYVNDSYAIAFPLNISKSSVNSRYIMVNGEKLEANLTINTFGKRKDYFFAWYPTLALAFLFTVSSFINNGEEMKNDD